MFCSHIEFYFFFFIFFNKKKNNIMNKVIYVYIDMKKIKKNNVIYRFEQIKYLNKYTFFFIDKIFML